jgi:ectoine hydroxylase-related dioxygenase (phytanoyl-CoA dioxygenase family)
MNDSLPIHRALVHGDDLASLRAWVGEVESWPPGSHRWGQYAERTPDGPVVCRTENVSGCHAGIAALVRGRLAHAARAVLGDDVVDFKDKINYKQPGGAGFAPHQDLLAYPGVNRVVSILVAVDECTTVSGCVWLAADVDEVLPTDERGVVADEVATRLSWSPAELAPGDAVCLGGLVPHYSEANRSDASRRVLVASYAPESAGYGRDVYYAARAREIDQATSRDRRFRISTLADFEGVEVGGGRPDPTGRCSHR